MRQNRVTRDQIPTKTPLGEGWLKCGISLESWAVYVLHQISLLLYRLVQYLDKMSDTLLPSYDQDLANLGPSVGQFLLPSWSNIAAKEELILVLMKHQVWTNLGDCWALNRLCLHPHTHVLCFDNKIIWYKRVIQLF